MTAGSGGIGQGVVSIDARERVLGQALYPQDNKREGMLFAATVRSQVAHACIRHLDLDRARAVPGVICVLSARDLPGAATFGAIVPDQPVFASDRVRFSGEALALVVGASASAVGQAAREVVVDYDPLPTILDPLSAMKEDAPHIHEPGNILRRYRIRRGNFDAALDQASVRIHGTYRTPFIDHAFLQPEAGLAEVDGDGALHIWVATQRPHDDQEKVAAALAIPKDKVFLHRVAVGGAFGGREDVTLQIHIALAAWLTRRPVMMAYSRSESMHAHTKRHAMTVRHTLAAAKDGKLLGVNAEIVADTGAYASVGPEVLKYSMAHVTGPYEVENVWADGYLVYTNNIPAGAMRGFGVPQIAFVHESQMDRLARHLAVDPVRLRMENLLHDGSVLATGSTLTSAKGLHRALEAALAATNWNIGDMAE